jgi:hypothetical protein
MDVGTDTVKARKFLRYPAFHAGTLDDNNFGFQRFGHRFFQLLRQLCCQNFKFVAGKDVQAGQTIISFFFAALTADKRLRHKTI